jgi:hypothetical protein
MADRVAIAGVGMTLKFSNWSNNCGAKRVHDNGGRQRLLWHKILAGKWVVIRPQR